MSRWESDPLTCAIDDQGALVHIDSVANGSACGCVCPSCGQPLIAKNSGSVLIHHFAHRKATCRWAVEAAVIHIVQSILLESGSMHVEGAGYMDLCEDCWFYFSPYGDLKITDVSQLDIDARQAPALTVSCVDGSGAESSFILVAVLARHLSEGQIEAYRHECGMILAIDFKGAYASMREREGRHFSRAEFLLMAQDRVFLESVLVGGEGSKILRWLSHPRRDAAEAESEERYMEELEEKSLACMLEFERAVEEMRLEVEHGWDAEGIR